MKSYILYIIEKIQCEKSRYYSSKILPEILSSIKWIKSMRWGSNNDRWIRPIKNILCF